MQAVAHVDQTRERVLARPQFAEVAILLLLPSFLAEVATLLFLSSFLPFFWRLEKHRKHWVCQQVVR